MKEIIELYKKTNKCGLSSKIKANKKYLSEINEYCKSYDTNSLAEKIYLYVNNTTPKYGPCGNKNKFISLTKGYTDFCSKKCPEIIKQQTKNRIKTLSKNGGIGLANEKSKQKAKNTLEKNYNVDNPGKIDVHRNNMKMNNPMKDENVIKNIKEKCLKTYNVDWHSKRIDIIHKRKNTTLEYYGVDNSSKKHYSQYTLNILENKDNIKELYEKMSVDDMANYLDVSLTTIYNYLLKHLLRDKKEIVAENQIIDFLKSLNIDNIQKRTRKIIPPKEIDIFLPDYNVAIEHCGLYWHSELRNCKRYYHYNKLKECNKQNIKLITIFEDEWNNKRTICENRIKHILNKNKTNVGARKLNIEEIYDKNIVYEFLENFHIQGKANFDVALGAYYKNELVSIMTFSKPRKYMKQNEIELSRFCTNGFNYPGVGSKLFKCFVKKYNPDKITSMCDLRWGNGNFYKNLDMIKEKITEPNYWYFGDKSNRRKRWYRFYFNKKTLLRKYPQYDSSLSEWDIMKDLGYDRIWDCGNIKFIWSKK